MSACRARRSGLPAVAGCRAATCWLPFASLTGASPGVVLTGRRSLPRPRSHGSRDRRLPLLIPPDRTAPPGDGVSRGPVRAAHGTAASRLPSLGRRRPRNTGRRSGLPAVAGCRAATSEVPLARLAAPQPHASPASAGGDRETAPQCGRRRLHRKSEDFRAVGRSPTTSRGRSRRCRSHPRAPFGRPRDSRAFGPLAARADRRTPWACRLRFIRVATDRSRAFIRNTWDVD